MKELATYPGTATRLLSSAVIALALAGLASTVATAAATSGPSKIVFNRDIRPILSENCMACHGPDPVARKAGLRLDTKEGLYEATPKRGPAVVPGDIAKSELWRRLVTTDKDDVMPPPDSHKDLKPGERELVKQWITEGGAWQPHWSFVAPERAEVPKGKGPKVKGKGSPVRNPIDGFVAAKLAEKGLAMNPEADRRTLARRLSLDLTGLPPTPAEVEAFVSDKSKGYYEEYVRRLMDSPRWGEHRGRYWLDAARYADTHGLHFDNYREMWPYRDWVIGAFNRNERFDQFVIDQIAGDLLPDPTTDQLVATGFHRCNMTTNEGGTIEEENLSIYANDRVTTTGWVFLGLTANCAACHDHKFDPITQRDFYSLAAFFRNTKQSGFDGNVKDGVNAYITVVTDEKEAARWKVLPGEIEAAKKAVAKSRADAEPAFADWIAGMKAPDLERQLDIPGLAFRAPLADGKTNAFAAMAGSTVTTASPKGPVGLNGGGLFGAAPVFGKGATAEFPEVGVVGAGEAFSYGAWVFVPPDHNETAAIFARMDPSKDGYRGWDLWIQQGQFATHLVSQWPDNAVKVRTRERVAKKGKWQHVLATYDGSGKPEGVKIFVDGVGVQTEAENSKGITGSIAAKASFTLAQRSEGSHFDGVALQDVRIYSRALSPAEVTALAHDALLRTLVGTPVADWKPEPKREVFEYFLATRHQTFRDAQTGVASLEKEKEGIRLKYPVTHIQMEKPDSKPMAAVLARGQYDKPKDKVEADVPAALNPLPPGAPRNRLGLARWLVAPENPLTARVTVNRFWQELFGTGLVKTTEDLGIMGETPVNAALLDWLAVEFRESGWDVKHLFHLMVTSSAYRQSAVATREKLDKDPANRLLSRGPRFRMDGEMVRDYALSASGLLVPKVGGPSVKPYQPQGVWEAVAMPESNTKRYAQDTGDGLYRRSMYTFWKRAAPPASMEVFNAPSREVSCTRRERTNTPLQALATMNDPQFIEAARRLAEAALAQDGGDTGRAIGTIAQRLLARPLRSDERKVVDETWAKLSGFYGANPDEAAKLVGVGESKAGVSVPAPRLAAMTMLANQLMNLDEVLNK